MPSDNFNIDRLIKVSAFDAIGDEANFFTPWLATHIDVLSRAIGIDLQFGEDSDAETIIKMNTEVPVGNYSLDIQAFTGDGRTAAIENQYNKSDHKHLGQVITYASGIGADLVIWIAESFTEAHLEALRWLNERTDADCGIFAVEITFVKIGDSDPAPSLSVLVAPSEIDREIRNKSISAAAWTVEDFLGGIEDDGDRESAAKLIMRTLENGGGVWCGKRPRGSLLLHPIKDQHSTIGLSIGQTSKKVKVSGLWTQFDDTSGHSAYEPMASLLGLSVDGPATARRLERFTEEDVWEAGLKVAEGLKAASEVPQ